MNEVQQNNVRYLEITPEEDGQRLDNYLVRVLKGVPKSHIYRIVRGGEVRVNKKRAKPSQRLCPGDLIRIPPIRTAEAKEHVVGDWLSECLQSSIIHEDDHLLVVNKPAGIAVHGGSGVSLGVIEAFRKMRPDLSYLELVHRLDKNTSGCLLLAKKRSMLRQIAALLEARQVYKTYWALVANPWEGKRSIIVNAPLLKNTLKSGERMVVVSDEGKASETRFILLKNYQSACFVEANPKTGRTHQIRVHSACIGHPILGDSKYGKNTGSEELHFESARLYLHARAIQFTLNDKVYRFQAELDDTFESALQGLGGEFSHE